MLLSGDRGSMVADACYWSGVFAASNRASRHHLREPDLPPSAMSMVAMPMAIVEQNWKMRWLMACQMA